MKAWELEEGKEYESIEDEKPHRIINGKLSYREEGIWYIDYSDYNYIKNIDFTETTDWTKIEIDTKVLVFEKKEWRRRYFAKYEHGNIYVFDSGRTSFSNGNNNPNIALLVKLYTE